MAFAQNLVFTEQVAAAQEALAFLGVIQSKAIFRVVNGSAAVPLEVRLKKNAVVRRFDVIVRANRASLTNISEVAEVRASSEDKSAVIDFGLMRTVSGVHLGSTGTGIVAVFPWTGAGFANVPIFSFHLRSGASAPKEAVFPEVRTERLRLVLSADVPGDELASEGSVILPEAPGDLELTIDGSAPVATLPGPVRPTEASELSDRDWNEAGQRIVSLKDAFAERTGDPLASDEAVFELVLSAKSPGVLGLDLGESELSEVHRARFGGSTERDVAFATEGLQTVVCDLPSNAQREVEEVRFHASGELEAHRVLEPIGPPPSALAELRVDPDHAFIVRLADESRLHALTGVRLPVAGLGGDAEARVVLWRSDAGGQPLEPVDGGSSDPVRIPALDTAEWTTFSLPEPLPLADEGALWAALFVSRGSVLWSLCEVSGGSPFAVHTLLSGKPSGAWRPLPPAMQPGGELAGLRGRVRIVGDVIEEEPLDPLTVNVAGAPDATTIELDPATDEAPHSIVFDPPLVLETGGQLALELVARAPGRVSLSSVDVIWRPKK